MYCVLCLNTAAISIESIHGPFSSLDEANDWVGNAMEAIHTEDPSPDFVYVVKPMYEPD